MGFRNGARNEMAKQIAFDIFESILLNSEGKVLILLKGKLLIARLYTDGISWHVKSLLSDSC